MSEPTERDKQLAIAVVRNVDNHFEHSERLRLGKWVSPDEREQTIAQHIAVALDRARAEAAAAAFQQCAEIAQSHANRLAAIFEKVKNEPTAEQFAYKTLSQHVAVILAVIQVVHALQAASPDPDFASRIRNESAIAAIENLHSFQLRCLRNCLPSNAPLNTILKYLDDAKEDALAPLKKKS